MSLTQESLKEWLHYCCATGNFTWQKKPARQIAVGTYAGHPAANYIQVRIEGVLYYAHRLAFLYMTGEWPKGIVDHDNGNGYDNSWKNLIDSNRIGNGRNSSLSKKNTSGVTGVTWDKRRGKWMAAIQVAGKNKFLGYSSDLEEAAAFRKAAEEEFGFNPNHGRPKNAATV